MSFSSSLASFRFCFSRTQLIFAAVFLLLNIALMNHANYSQPYPGGPLVSPTYLTAADGQRYWGVAISLAERGSFSVPPLWDSRPEYPLARSGPLTALIYSVPIRLVGFEQAAYWIVLLQCAFLYVIALTARVLAPPFRANPSVLQGLILFNPNLIGLSHVAQSDLFFAGVFTLFLCYLTKFLLSDSVLRYSSFMVLALLLGMLTMIRDIGVLFSIFFPFLLVAVIALSPISFRLVARKLAVGILLGTLVYCVVVAPWTIRNYIVFGHLSPTAGQVQQVLHYNYKKIRSVGTDGPGVAHESYINAKVTHALQRVGRVDCAPGPKENPSEDCNQPLRDAYLASILAEPKTLIAVAALSAAGRTLFSGGILRISDYLGFSEIEKTALIVDSRLTVSHLTTYISRAFSSGYQQITTVILCLSFVLLTRLSGFSGLLYSLIRQSDKRYLVALHGLVIAFFLLVYFAISTSRFRAPLEPILMLYTAVGIHMLSGWTKKKG